MSRINSAPAKYAILFFGCVLFHIAGTWNLPLIDRDEPRFAEASREMIQRGDYVVPYFNGQFRFDKPPLTYWTQVISFRIFGENDFAARFPSTIAAAFIGVVLLAWGTRVAGARTGWWATIIFTLSLQTFVHAKAAVADVWLVLFVTLAYWAGWQLLFENSKRSTPNLPPPWTGSAVASVQRPTSNWFWWSVFYLSLALAFLAKGPIAWVPLLTVWSTLFFARESQLGLRFRFVRGILLMLAIVSVWGIPALMQTHGEFFSIGIGRHVIGRSFGAMEGHGANSFGSYLVSLPFYLVTVFVSFFPWSIKLPWLLKKVWRERDRIDNYLIAGAAIIFIIFTLVKTKLPHYTLPAFPLLALLLARHWSQQVATFFKPIAAATTCLWLAIASIVPPLVARDFPAYALFQESRDALLREMEFGAVDYTEPSLVWYFRSRVNGFLTPLKRKEATEFMSKPGPRFLVMPTTLADTLFHDHPASWESFSSRGFNIAKGKNVDLTLLLKER